MLMDEAELAQLISITAEPYRVADLSLAAEGRAEMTVAHREMPGLSFFTKKYAAGAPLAGVRVTGALHVTAQTAVLMQSLKACGAELRWCSSNIYTTQDRVAAALVSGDPEAELVMERPVASVFAWSQQTVQEYWWCMLQALTWPEEAVEEEELSAEQLSKKSIKDLKKELSERYLPLLPRLLTTSLLLHRGLATNGLKQELIARLLENQENSEDRKEHHGPDLIIDDSGDACMLIHEGVEAEENFFHEQVSAACWIYSAVCLGVMAAGAAEWVLSIAEASRPRGAARGASAGAADAKGHAGGWDYQPLASDCEEAHRAL